MPQIPTLPFVHLISQLIGNIFVDYTCLNVHVHQTFEHQQNEVVRELHKMAFTFIVTDNFTFVNCRCGFLLLSTSAKSMDHLGKQIFDAIIRILIISDDNKRILTWLKNNPTLQDMDVLLVEVDALSGMLGGNIYRKSRHQIKVDSVDTNSALPLFEPPFNFTKYTDYQKRIMKISTFHCPVFGSIKENGTQLADGVETRILHEIMRKLNLVPEVMVPKDGKRWGTAYPNKTISGGIIKSLYTKKTDVGFCSLWIESTKFPYMDMSGYWEILCLKFLIPKPKAVATHWNNIFKPLPVNLWILVLLTTIIITLVSSSLRCIQSFLFKISQEGVELISEFITIVGLLVMAKNPDKPHDYRVNRHLFLWWSVFAMIITSIYSSSLISHLTYPQFEPMIDTPEGFVKAGLYWGTPYEPPKSHIFDMSNEWHQKFAERFQFEEKRTDRVRRIREGNYSVFVKCIGDVHFMEVQDVPIEILRELRTPKSCFGYFMLALGFRKTLPYAEQANRIVRHLVESGVTKYWLDRLFEKEYRSTTFAKVYEYKIPPEDVKLQALRPLNLQGVFGLLCAGVALACVVFALEILSHRKAKSN